MVKKIKYILKIANLQTFYLMLPVKKVIVLLFLIGTILFATLSPRAATDLPYIYPDVLNETFGVPQTWSTSLNSLGYYNLLTLWSWPLGTLYAFGGKLGLSYSFLQGLFGFSAISVIGILGISKLLEYYTIRGWAKWLGVAVYVLNTYFLLLVDGGQLSIALAYSWFPLAFLGIENSLTVGLKKKLLAGLSVSVLGILDIRFVFILIIPLVLKLVYAAFFLPRHKLYSYVISWLSSGVVISVVVLLLNLYWLVPAVLGKAPELPSTYQRVSQTAFLGFIELKHSILLFQPHWPKNVFGKTSSPDWWFAAVPLLAFFAPLMSKKRKEVFFWWLIGGVGIFLAKGAQWPFGEIYVWLFKYFPGFSLFRDSSKFLVLVALAYSLLAGFALQRVFEFFKSSRLKIAFLGIFFLVYLIFLVRPLWLGDMTGLFSRPRLINAYSELTDYLSQDSEYGRVLWIPRRAPLGYVSPTHGVLEAEYLSQLRPFMASTVGTYETLNFLRESPLMGELMDILGVKYIVYPYPDPQRFTLKADEAEYFHTFWGQLTALPWLEYVNNFGPAETPVVLFKTNQNEPEFFVSSNAWFVVGSDAIYNEFVKIPGFKLSNNATTFLEENEHLGKLIDSYPNSEIILYNKDDVDLTMVYLANPLIFPAAQLNFDPDSTGWWKRETADLVWWRNFLHQKYGIDNLDFDYGGGWAVAEGSLILSIPSSKSASDSIVLARLMKSPRSGSVSFFQGDKLIGKVDTDIKEPQKTTLKLTGFGTVPDRFFEYAEAPVSWVEVGKLTGNGGITIQTQGDINVINAVALVSKADLTDAKNKVQKFKEQGRVIYWDQASIDAKTQLAAPRSRAQIDYQKISPTRYRLHVQGVEKPATLLFSQTFDSFWQLTHKNEQVEASYPVYGLINGFELSEDGDYELRFSAQDYVLPGFVVSMLALAAIAVFLLV